MRDTEDRLVNNNIVVRPGSSSAFISLVFHTTPETQKINFGALRDAYMAGDIAKRFENERISLEQLISAIVISFSSTNFQ